MNMLLQFTLIVLQPFWELTLILFGLMLLHHFFDKGNPMYYCAIEHGKCQF